MEFWKGDHYNCHVTNVKHHRVNEFNFDRWNKGLPATNYSISYLHREFPIFGVENEGKLNKKLS